MINQRQPNNWSCLPTAFATATGVLVEDLIEAIGHDGSEIVFPKLPEPLCRRAFHPQECLNGLYSLYESGLVGPKYLFVPWSKEVYCQLDEVHSYVLKQSDRLFERLLAKHDGVIIGEINNKLHAAAWNTKEQMAYDPNGFIYPISKYEIHHFYLKTNLI